MEKVVSIIIAAVLSLSALTAKDPKKMNWEFGANYKMPVDKYQAHSTEGKFGGYFEVRYNLQNIPIDIGLLLDVGIFKREYKYEMVFVGQEYKVFNVLPKINYTFNKHGKISPYAGAGAGISFNNTASGIFNEGFGTNFCFIASAGLRFFNRINLGLDIAIIKKEYSQAGIRLGYYF